MSSTARRRQLGFFVVAVSGALAGCSQTSMKTVVPDAGGTSATGGMTDGHQSGTGGGTAAPGSGGESGAGHATGGASGSSGGGGQSGGSGGMDGGTLGEPVGGAQGTVAEPYFRAGTRLKPLVYRAGDLEVLDSTAETSWYDAKLGAWCTFKVGADGVERCLPNNLFVEDGASNRLSYLDATCTRPAVRSGGPCDGRATNYLTVEPASSCSYRVYRMGAPRASSTPLYQKMDGGSCRRLPAATDGLQVFPLEEELPPGTFVAVKRVSRPRHPGMNAWVREGEDGSSEIVGFVDPVRDVPCFALGQEVSLHACIPGHAAQTASTFSDSSCTQLVGFEDDRRCVARPNPVLLLDLQGSASSCSRTQSINGVWQSAGVRSTRLFTAASGTCEPLPGEASPVHDRGAPVELASLPRLEVIEVGSGPVRLPFYGFGGVPFLPVQRGFDNVTTVGPFKDVASGEPCEPFMFADRTWRCVPTSFIPIVDFELLYESEDCTGGRAYSVGNACADARPAPRGVLVSSFSTVIDCVHPVIETIGFEGRSSAASVSRRGLAGPACERLPASPDASLFRASNALDPAELFGAMERRLKD